MGENKIECLNIQAISWYTMNIPWSLGLQQCSEKEMKKNIQSHIFVVFSSIVLFGIESSSEFYIVLFIVEYDLLRYWL